MVDVSPDLSAPLAAAAAALPDDPEVGESVTSAPKSRRKKGPAVCPGCDEKFDTHRGLANHKRSCPKVKPSDRPKPRTNAGASSTGSKVTKPTLRDKLASLITTASLPVSMVDAYDGAVLAANAEPLADALTDLAARNPRVKAWLESLVTGGDYTALALVLVSIILPIAIHHSPALRAALGERADLLAQGLGAPPDPQSPSQGRQPDSATAGQ